VVGMFKFKVWLVALVAAMVGLSVLSPTTTSVAAAPDPCAGWMDTSTSASARADALVHAMTLDQKLHMLTFSDPAWFLYYGTAGHVTGTPELCIPDLVLSDAGSGVAGMQYGTTTFPSGVAQASTWDPALQRMLGRAIGAEAHAKGINVMLGPGMNIARTPYNGRNFEYFGEDPYLASRTAVSVIKGIQDNPVLATAKHYALNNQEIDRNTINVRASERTMREIYLPAFEASVREGHVGSVMCAYNKVHGRYACENQTLLTRFLRTDWGFKGFVMSDWGAVHSTAPSANAGLDLEMHAFEAPTPPTPVTGSGARYFSASALKAALANGSVTMARINGMVRNIVRPMFAEGLFDHPIAPGLPAYTSDVTAAHQALARRVAADATVMLKNRDGLLPLSHEGGRTIAVIGWAAGPVGAANSTSGGGSSRTGLPGRVISPLEGITAQAQANGDQVVYVDGTSTLDAQLAASAADIAIVVANDGSTEGADRPDLGLHPGVCATLFCQNLPVDQTDLIAAVTQANPRTVVVLDVGGPVKMPWLPAAGAVLLPWYGGLQHGNALADIIYGRSEPGGRLPQTLPVSESQLSFNPEQYPGTNGTETYSEGLMVGYRWWDATGKRPLFPFGYGLGYTTFSFANLEVVKRGAGAEVSMLVRNTGDRSGWAVPQVYVGAPGRAAEPPRQLKGFEKLRLQPGQARTVTLHLGRRAFSQWSSVQHRWIITPGIYRILAGSSSRDLPLRGSVVQGVSN